MTDRPSDRPVAVVVVLHTPCTNAMVVVGAVPDWDAPPAHLAGWLAPGRVRTMAHVLNMC